MEAELSPFILLAQRVVTAIPSIVSGVIVIIGFWILAVVVRAFVSCLRFGGNPMRSGIFALVAQTAFWAIIILGFVSGFGTMGIDVAALIATLGLAGFALGFALRDVVSNLVAGVLILIYRPFGYGDRIAVTGFEGKVQDIDLRYTTVLGDDNRRFYIPNQTMYSSPVTVFRPPTPEAKADAQMQETS